MSIHDGGPAYPATEQNGCNSGVPGMFLRDAFAIAALQGICANPNFAGRPDQLMGNYAANAAYCIADEMLSIRAVGGGE